MPEGLMTSDGQAVPGVPAAGEQDFAELMTQAAEQADVSAPPPPKRDYGVKDDGTPKKAAGRPRKPAAAEKPRIQAPPKAAAAPVRDYSQDLAEFTEGVWFLLAQLPPTQAQAAVLKAHRPGLVHGWNLAAQSNAMIRAGVEAITGKGTWVAAVAMATAPFVLQSLALWTKPDAELAAVGMPTKDDLAASTMRDLEELARQQEEALRAAAGVTQAA